jgi:threonine/homoserine/homoserine lactone efflux protein
VTITTDNPLELYLAYVVACIALALLPGPNVTLLIANGLRHGTRAAMICLAGTQVGLAIVIAIVGAGLTTLMATMGYWFDWVRLAGAAYLIWLGIGMLRAKATFTATEDAVPPRGGFFLQGLLVLLSNPKVLVFFGAFIPQFVDMKGDHFSQVVLLGATFMVIAGITDAVYALLAGRARVFLSERRALLLSRMSGLFMIGGGVWLALTRAR